MWEEKNKKNINNDVWKNIFDEFIQDKTQDSSEKNKKKSYQVYDYLRVVSKILVFINVFLFITIVLWLYYNSTQANEERKELAFLEPICNVLVWDVYSSWNPCYSVSYLLSDYQKKFNTLEESTIKRIFPLISDIYSITNFNFSDKVVFLNKNSNDRLKPLIILEDFDSIKREFTSERSNVSCQNISLSENIMSLSCDIYSSDWDTNIIDLQGGIRSTLEWWWTSISRASSFINFIESHNSARFRIIQKPQVFSSNDFTDDGPYTQFTTVDLTLQYVNPDFLSF